MSKWKYLLPVFFLVLLAAFLLNVSKPGRRVEGCPQGCSTAAERQSGPLRVLSLNMLHGFPKFEHLQTRLDLIASEILHLDADVVLLQETPWTRGTGSGAEYLAGLLGYNYLYFRANGNRHLIFFEEGETILSRFPLKDPVFTVLEPKPGFFENRVALGAIATTPWGAIAFFDTHLSGKTPEVGQGQVESLKEFVEGQAGGLAVVGGDFNAREDSPQIVDLSTHWIDSYRKLHPDEPGLTCCNNALTAGPGESFKERVDYLFLVPEPAEHPNLISARRVFDQPFPSTGGWQWASDHAGLFVEIEP
jgi:endonuclease/exonuclease/phosphatase family metal-dependent hydrolase